MQSLTVELGSRSYPIHIGAGPLLLILPQLVQKRVAIVSNTTVAPLYLKTLIDGLALNDVGVPIILPDVEQYKTRETLNTILKVLS